MVSNKYNLPKPLFKALSVQRYPPIPQRISVTHLIDSPLIRVLNMKHAHEIEEDASENLWALLGKAIHYVVEKSGAADTSEVKMSYKHPSGATLVTRGDYYDELTKTLIDWKCVSAYAYLLGGKKSWEKQLNVTRYVMKHGSEGKLDIQNLAVYAILRDWALSKSYEHDYPNIPFQEVNLPVWDDDFLNGYVDTRVAMHLVAENYIDNINMIDTCSPEERWERPTTYAFKKKDVKKAIRVLDTMDDILKYAQKQTKAKADSEQELIGVINKMGYEIEIRPGASVKCESYCAVNKWCPWYIQQHPPKSPALG